MFFLFFEYNRKVLHKSLIKVLSSDKIDILVIDWLLFSLILNMFLIKLDFFTFSRSFCCNKQIFSVRFADYFVSFFCDVFLLSTFESKMQFFMLENLDKVISYLRNSFKISKNNFNFLSIRILLNSSKYSKVHFPKIYVIRFLTLFKYLIEKNCNISTYFMILNLRAFIFFWFNFFLYNRKNDRILSILDLKSFLVLQSQIFYMGSDKNSRSFIKEKYFPSENIYFFQGKYFKDNWVFCSLRIEKKSHKKFLFLPKISWI